jgi:hypothetical protein
LPASGLKNENTLFNVVPEGSMMEERIVFTCPVCGRKTDRSTGELKEGVLLTCPFCKLKLTLHGHMWEDVQKAMKGSAGKKGPEQEGH